MLKGWKKITNEDISKIKKFNEGLKHIEYYNSIIYQIYSKMIYKFIDDKLIIAKATSIMGTYAIVKFFGDHSLNDKLYNNGITLRGHDIDGKKDKFGDEYIYDTNDYIKLEGSRFTYFRKALSRYNNDLCCELGYNDDIYTILEKYPKYQTKLFDVVKNNLELVTIIRVYYKDKILGFSVVENINKNNGISLQKLFDKDMGIRHASYLMHYYHCIINKNKLLNAGGTRTKNIKFAKQKLRPCKLLRIKRKVPIDKLTKQDWVYFRNNMI